jgi:predicted nucleic acid-binding protein
MLYLLDTNAIADVMDEHPRIGARLTALMLPDEVGICTIVRGEVLFGIERMPEGKRRRELSAKASGVLGVPHCHTIPESAGDHYARIKQACRRKRLPMDENDLWIAATAFALAATLVTRDRDFDKVDGLRVEDWTR